MAALTVLLMLPNASALLQVNYSNQINFAQFSEYASDVFINNTNDYDIFNVTFSPTNVTERFIPINITKNTSTTVRLIFYSNTSLNYPYPITLSYSKIIEYTRTPTNNNTILFEPTQFEPNEFTVVAGSQIVFINKDNITHVATSYYFDQDVAPGRNFTYQFNDAGNQVISEPTTGYSMLLHIIPQHELIYVHDSAQDVVLNYNVNISRVETALDIAMLQPTNNYFYLSLGSLQQEGVLRIMNNGNRTSENIQISAPWFTIDKNIFSLEPGHLTLIKLTTNPDFSQSDFNHDIQKQLTITSDNTQTQYVNITFYINSSGLSNGTEDDWTLQFMAQLIEFCKRNPHHRFCDPNPPTEIIEKPVYYEKSIGVNYTMTDVYNLNRNYQTLQEQFRAAQTAQNQKLDEYNQKVDKATSQVITLKDTIEEVRDNTNKTTTISLAQQQENYNYRDLFLRGMIIALIAIAAVAIALLFMKIADDKHKMRGYDT